MPSFPSRAALHASQEAERKVGCLFIFLFFPFMLHSSSYCISYQEDTTCVSERHHVARPFHHRAITLSSSVALPCLRTHEKVGFLLPFRLYARQREQGETQITYFDQHSMQGGLINDWAREDGFSIVHHGDGQSIKPI